MCEKHVFFAAVEQNKRSQSVVWVSTPQGRKPVLFSVFWNDKVNNYGIGKQKTKQVFPFVVLKPTQRSGFSRSVQQQQKKRDFRT